MQQKLIFPAPGSSHALEKRRNRIWRANLDHNIKVTNIDAEFQGAGADNTGTLCRGECCF